MPFPRDQLRPHEELVLDTKPHWWFIAPMAALLAGALLLGVIVLPMDDGFLGDSARIVSGIIVLGALGLFAHRYAQWVSTNFVVTSDRIVYRHGIFAKKGVEIPVDKINAVFFEQRVIERLFGLGKIKVESASETGASVFDDIPKPSAVQSIIYGVIDQQSDDTFDRMGQATAQAMRDTGNVGGAGAGLSVAEQLEKLHALHQQGAITDAEYAAQKARLMGNPT
jgi:uncharacterized membrane protein YdbT with pleckstrin-like domain